MPTLSCPIYTRRLLTKEVFVWLEKSRITALHVRIYPRLSSQRAKNWS